MVPNFVLIIGAMKSGTTTLYHYLAQHPQISTGPVKELDFFSNDEFWRRGIGWYESQFNFDPSQHRYALDASTNYTKHPYGPDLVPRIKSTAPRQYKLIYIMRHPLRRIESHALFAELTGAEFGRRPAQYKSYNFDAGISPAAIAFSLYAYQIDKFSEFYDEGALLLLTMEQLKGDPIKALTKVYDFLGIDKRFPSELSLQSNAASAHYLPPPLISALFKFTPVRAVARAVLPKAARQRIYDAATELGRPTGRFSLNADEELALMATLSRDLARLRDRYNVDIEKEWGIVL